MSEYELVATPKTTRAVMDVAARYGVPLYDHVAAQIAEAVLECADDDHRVHVEVAPELWGGFVTVSPNHEVRTHVRERLRRQLAVELTDLGLLPTALPREVVTHSATRPWEPVKVELVVPVRHPSRR